MNEDLTQVIERLRKRNTTYEHLAEIIWPPGYSRTPSRA
jgi:hypothetical protein